MLLPPVYFAFNTIARCWNISPLKIAMPLYLKPLFQTGISWIDKAEWIEKYILAKAKAFTVSNIQGGWRSAGLWPVDPRKVIWKVAAHSPTPERNIQSNINISSSNSPFQQITSSPLDSLVLSSANRALNQLIASNKLLTTPARTFVHHLTNAAEQFQAELAIAQKQYIDLHAVVTARAASKYARQQSLQGDISYSGNSSDIRNSSRTRHSRNSSDIR